MALLDKILRTDPIKKLEPLVEKINAFESEFEKLKAEDFPVKTSQWREQIVGRLTGGEKLDDVLNEYLPQAFALVRAAAKRNIGQRHFDVQLMGGIIMHQGKIAEMK